MVVPRTSRYVIELSAEERYELERRGREDEVVAVACELPARHERPLGRFSRT
jgi:hypothetical protein